MAPQPLNSTDSIQLNPGRAIGEAGDGRGVAGSHMFEDETVEAAVFDPVAATWGAPQLMRGVGAWEEQQYTRMEVARTDDGAVLVEDGNGRLFAHHVVGDAWTHAELTSVPNKRYIFDVEPAPDGRVAVLVMSQTAWDQPSALHVAFFDPSTDAWSPGPHVFVDDPALAPFIAQIVFDTDDGDAMVVFITQPFDANWPRTGELHRFDAETQTWSQLRSDTGYVWWVDIRELEPGEFVYYPLIGEDEGGSYFFTEMDGLGDPTDVPFPDDYVDGTLRKITFEWDRVDMSKGTLEYRTYARDDAVGNVDTLPIGSGSSPVDFTSTHAIAKGGRAYATWWEWGPPFTMRAAVHDGAWSETTVLGSHNNHIGPTSLTVNEQGDAVVGWSPTCGGPCPDDPTRLAGYTVADGCWHEGLVLDEGADAIAYTFSSTTDFVISTVGAGHQARLFSCM
jgi:hypothetical protein